MKSDKKSLARAGQAVNYLAEKPEPITGKGELPVAFIVVLLALIFGAGMFMDYYGGSFRPDVFTPYRSFAQLDSYQVKNPAEKLFAQGKKLFSERGCAGCHGENGIGAADKPPLAGSEWVLAPKPDRLVAIVRHGLAGPIKVKGKDWNFVMLAVGETFTPEEMAAVLTYIRGNKDWGNNASPVQPEEAKAILERLGPRRTNWTAPELEKIPDR